MVLVVKNLVKETQKMGVQSSVSESGRPPGEGASPHFSILA